MLGRIPLVSGCGDLGACADFLPGPGFFGVFFFCQNKPLSMHALGHSVKPRDHGARPRLLRHVREHALEKRPSIFDTLKLLPF